MGLELGEVCCGNQGSQTALFQKARRNPQQARGRPVGFQYHAVGGGDQIAVGGKFKQVLVAPPLGFQACLAEKYLFILDSHLFVGDSQLFHAGLKLCQGLRQQAAWPGACHGLRFCAVVCGSVVIVVVTVG